MVIVGVDELGCGGKSCAVVKVSSISNSASGSMGEVGCGGNCGGLSTSIFLIIAPKLVAI